MKRRLFFVFLLLTAAAVNPAVFAQDDGTVPAIIVLSHEGVPAGGNSALAVVFTVPPDHHITSVENGLFYVEITPVDGFTFQPPVFPPAVDFEGEEVYQGEVPVIVDFAVAPELKPGEYELKIAYGYQICVETGSKMCYLPQNAEGETIVKIVEAGSTPIPSHTYDLGPSGNTAAVLGTTPESEATLEQKFSSALKQGSALAFLLVFIAGILSSLTPCVYPVIPITIGYIGGRAEGQKFKGFLLSLFLVLGIAIVYSTLGIVAAASGSVFGSFTQHPAVLIVIALIFAVMGTSMLGAFEIQLPSGLQGKMRTEKKGFGGALLVGMITGLVAAPCVGPVLVALLAWVAQTGSILTGFALLFTYAVGMGLLFIVIGTFAGAMTALPGAGQWMDTVKHVFGIILIGGAIFIVNPLVAKGWYYLLWGIFLIVTGVFSGALEILSQEPSTGKKWGKAIGVVLLIFGIVMFVDGYNHTFGFKKHETPITAGAVGETAGIQWIVNDHDGAFAQAKTDGSYLIMDFYADWCVACKELDEKTWPRPELIAESEGWIFLKMDLTKMTPELKTVRDKYEIVGMPTVIFFDPRGNEKHRFAGFKPAEDVVKIMRSM